MYVVCGKHVHECVGEYICVDIYGGQRLTQYFPPQLFSLFFETRFLTEPDTVLARVASSEPWQSTCLCTHYVQMDSRDKLAHLVFLWVLRIQTQVLVLT